MDEEKSVGFLLKQIHNNVCRLLNSNLKKEDLTISQMAVLNELFLDEKCSFKKLENKMNIQRSTLIGILQRLDAKGFIEYLPDECDKRCRVIRLTQKSYEAKNIMEGQKKHMDMLITKNMTEKEQETLYDLLSKVKNNICMEVMENEYQK